MPRPTVKIRQIAGQAFYGQPSIDAPAPTDGIVRTEGAPRPARLIEFQ